MIWPFLAIFDIFVRLTKTKVFIVTGMEHNYVPNFDLLVHVGPEIKVLKDLASFWQFFWEFDPPAQIEIYILPLEPPH